MKTGIAVFDLHYPEHNKKLWKNIMRLTKDLSPDYFIFGGDNLNMTPLSHWIHDKGEARKLEGKRIKAEYNEFNKDIQDPLNKILKKDCKKHWMYGNHEDWAEQAIDKNPQGEGFWEVENNIHFDDWKKYRYLDILKIGRMHFIHGEYTNDAHAKKTVTTYEKNIFYGHDHDYQVYSKVTPVKNEARAGTSVPCACNLNPDYMRNKSLRWVNGLMVFYINPDNSFNAYTIVATKGNFTFNGKRYE